MTIAQAVGKKFEELKQHLRDNKIYFRTNAENKITQIVVPEEKKSLLGKKQRTGKVTLYTPKAKDNEIVLLNLVNNTEHSTKDVLGETFKIQHHG